jgi:hypothetical protein
MISLAMRAVLSRTVRLGSIGATRIASPSSLRENRTPACNFVQLFAKGIEIAGLDCLFASSATLCFVEEDVQLDHGA